MRNMLCVVCLGLMAIATGCCTAPDPSLAGPATNSDGWVSLFDGKTLSGWKASDYDPGAGKVSVVDGAISIGAGEPMTGIHRPDLKGMPKIDYLLEFEAQRSKGFDFFCGLTFPVGDKPLSLILGGWGGGLTGLSNLDGFDAANNDSSEWFNYKEKVWYKVRLLVTAKRVQAAINGETVVNSDITEKEVGIRAEVEPSLPFGIATFNTTGLIRGIRIRPLTAGEIKVAHDQ